MTLDKRARLKGRCSNVPERFAGVPIQCMDSPGYIVLSSKARDMLFELARQYNGRNNGDLGINYKLLKPRGWNSQRAMYKARDELEQSGWIVTTRHGGRNRCSLYALTFKPIDDCKGRHDAYPGNRPLGFWELCRNPWLNRRKEAA